MRSEEMRSMWSAPCDTATRSDPAGRRQGIRATRPGSNATAAGINPGGGDDRGGFDEVRTSVDAAC